MLLYFWYSLVKQLTPKTAEEEEEEEEITVGSEEEGEEVCQEDIVIDSGKDAVGSDGKSEDDTEVELEATEAEAIRFIME